MYIYTHIYILGCINRPNKFFFFYVNIPKLVLFGPIITQ